MLAVGRTGRKRGEEGEARDRSVEGVDEGEREEGRLEVPVGERGWLRLTLGYFERSYPSVWLA